MMEAFTTLLLLESLTELMRLESACLSRGLVVQVEPIPPHLRSGCMMGLAVRAGDLDQICQQLDLWGYSYEIAQRRART